MSTDDQLLDAAAAIVRRGEPLSVSAVAAEAGIARGAVYRRFADKESLAAALVASGRVESAPDTRERILDAVGRMLKRDGLSGTTLDEVAREAGVGPATVYRRFGDRRGLLGAFVRERTPRRLAEQLDPAATPPDRLLHIARENIRFLREYRELAPLLLTPQPDPDGLLAELRAGSTSTRALVAQDLGQHFPDPTGRTTVAFQGLMTAVGLFGTDDVEDDARFVVNTFLYGVTR